MPPSSEREVQYGVRYSHLADRPGMIYTHWETSPVALTNWLFRHPHIRVVELVQQPMPRVLNQHKDFIPEDAIYIGRPSKWGNPFYIGEDGRSREDCIQEFRQHLNRHPELIRAARKELRGKDLVCFCAPLPCHGDILLKVANGGLP